MYVFWTETLQEKICFENNIISSKFAFIIFSVLKGIPQFDSEVKLNKNER